MTNGQPPAPDLIRDAIEEPARKAAKRAEDALRYAATLRLMGSEEGRAEVYRELAPLWLHVGRADTANRWDPHAIAYAIGKHDEALARWRVLERVCPRLLAALVTENIASKGDQ